MSRPEKAASFASPTKMDILMGMLQRPEGATSKQMEAATDWKDNSVRGFLGSLRKKGVSIASEKAKGSATVYRVKPEQIGDVI